MISCVFTPPNWGADRGGPCTAAATGAAAPERFTALVPGAVETSCLEHAAKVALATNAPTT